MKFSYLLTKSPQLSVVSDDFQQLSKVSRVLYISIAHLHHFSAIVHRLFYGCQPTLFAVVHQLFATVHQPLRPFIDSCGCWLLLTGCPFNYRRLSPNCSYILKMSPLLLVLLHLTLSAQMAISTYTPEWPWVVSSQPCVPSFLAYYVDQTTCAILCARRKCVAMMYDQGSSFSSMMLKLQMFNLAKIRVAIDLL